MNRGITRLGLTALALVAAVPRLEAQQPTGAIRGRITDGSTGTPMGNVQVTIRNLSTNAVRMAQTGNDGIYRFIAMPVGKYKVTYKSGDRSYTVDASIGLGVDSEYNFKFPKEASATVEVVAGSVFQPIDESSAQTSVNVPSEVLADLPVLNRNVVEAAVLAPGVQIVQGSQVDPTKKASSYISTGEGQGRGTNFNIDGSDNNSSDVGGYVSSVPMDSVQEFQVVTNQYKAEFGRSNAGFFNVVTKSGGNEFAGVVSAQFTNDSMRARKTDENPKSKDDRLTIGATVSGPIIKDRLFYMVALEHVKANDGQPYVFPAAAVAAYPALGGMKSETKATTMYSKFDFIINPTWSTTFTLGYDKNETPNQAFPHTGVALGYVDPGMMGDGKNETKRGSIKVTGNFGAAVWESILSYFDYANGISPSKAGRGNGTPIQLRMTTGPVSERAREGQDPNAFQNTGIKRLQWRNDLTYVAGSHILKGGLDYQSSELADQRLFFQETGVYQLRHNLGIGQAWASSVQADVNVRDFGLVADGFQAGDKYKQYGLYVQDDFTLNNNWSIYAGLRMDKDTVFDFMKQYEGLYAQINRANPAFLGGGVPTNKTYVSPRLQVTYKPHGDDSLVFRLGAGRFVANTIDNVVGFSRALGNKANGLPYGGLYTNWAVRQTAWNYAFVNSLNAGPLMVHFGDPADAIPFMINGHQVVLPAALTPYNYINNINGLRDYFRNTVHGWLSTASFTTGGKNLMESKFEYPTTDTINLAVAFKWAQYHTLDANFVYSRTRNATVYYSSDGSGPLAWSPIDGSQPMGQDNDQGDNIFRSNQSARSKQLQVKYAYTRPNLSFLFNIVAKENTSTYGGSGDAFGGGGGADFYGGGANPAYTAGPERPSVGTEALNGSMVFSYRWEQGTALSIMSTWHSGKYYDIALGVTNDDNGDLTFGSIYNPVPLVGTGQGCWNMDMGVRISHRFEITKRFAVEPYVAIQNLLNNYDYGSGYDGTIYMEGENYNGDYVPVHNPTFRQRDHGWQANRPRAVAFGVRVTF